MYVFLPTCLAALSCISTRSFCDVYELKEKNKDKNTKGQII